MLANFGIGTLARALLLPLLLSACGAAQGDFGRLKTGLVDEDIHRWVGRDAARAVGVEPSRYPLTDEERTLRDLGYPLIELPFDRAKWYSIVHEYGVTHHYGWPEFRVEEYSAKLMGEYYRSATARYHQLNTDIRNDVVRIPDFFMTARRVLDLDRKRAESFRYVSGLTPAEAGNANARIAENQLVVGWVQVSLVQRSEAYCFALQRLVIATPAPMAVEVERSLTLLNTRIAENNLITTGQFAVNAASCGAQVAAAPGPGIVSK
jgi:hypothetical protein